MTESTNETSTPSVAKRTRKCKNIMAVVVDGLTLVPVTGFPDNLVSKDKAIAWIVKNAKDNDGPRDVTFVRLLGKVNIAPVVGLKVKVS